MTRKLKKNRNPSLPRASFLGWLAKAAPSTGRRLDLQMLEERVLYSATPLPIDPDAVDDTSAHTIDAHLDHMDAALVVALGPDGNTATTGSLITGSLVTGSLATGYDTTSIDASLDSLDGLQQQLVNLDSDNTGNTASHLADVSTAHGTAAAAVADSGLRHEVVFLQSTLYDLDQLTADLFGHDTHDRAIDVIVLDQYGNGFAQIDAALSQYTDVDAIHFVTHGADGLIQLGGSWLSAHNVGEHFDDLVRWGMTLTEDGDILIYGCDVAVTDFGQGLVDSIALATRADVAASTDGTGGLARGGNWDFEYFTQDPFAVHNSAAPANHFFETASVFGIDVQESYGGLLATYTVTNTSNAGAGSLRQAILDANANPGLDSIVFNIALNDVNHVYYRDNGVAGTFSAPVHTTLADGAITDFDADYLSGTARSWYRITLTGAELEVADAVIVDGSTQSGHDAAKGPIIELNAAGVIGGDPNGLALTSGASTVRGLVINRAADDAIEIDVNAGGSTIVGNYLGTDVSGLQTTFGNHCGITIKSDGNTIVATDASGLTDNDDIAINVAAANDVPLFGVGAGFVINDIAGDDDYAQSVAIQADGKLVVAGVSFDGSHSLITVARYNPDGSLDPTFGGGDGIATSGLNANDCVAYRLTLQIDGKILVAGASSDSGISSIALVRFNVDGTLDSSFGGGHGYVLARAGDSDFAHDVTALADGKILVAGRDDNNGSGDFIVIRFNSDGSQDDTFGSGGVVTSDLGGSDFANTMAVQADGKILLAGQSADSIAMVRYNSDGSLDYSFGTSGVVKTVIGVSSNSQAITLQADGKILLAGSILLTGDIEYGDPEFALLRYNSGGTLDTSFGGGDGVVTTAIAASSSGHSVELQTDGGILVAGYSNDYFISPFTVVRYNSDGSLDTRFGGGDGIVTTEVGGSQAHAYGLATQADGKFVVVGGSYVGGSVDFALARYNADGRLDTGFGVVGKLGGTVSFVEGGAAVVLDSDVTVTDIELSEVDDFDGASLTLARHSIANADDAFSATGSLSALNPGGNLVYNGVVVGTVTTNSGGTLVLTFNNDATGTRVNGVMQAIAYSNTSDTPPASAQIEWTFNDGNTGAQGSGGALTARGSTLVNITAVNDEQVLTTNAGLTVAENSTGNAISTAMLETTDVDNTRAELVYTVTSTAGNGTVRLSGTALAVSDTFTQDDIDNNRITYDHDGSETDTDAFSFSVDDGAGTASTGVFALAIAPANDNAPVITSNGGGDNAFVDVAETTTFVTTVTATVIDLPAQSLTYSIVGGTDSLKFHIASGTGELIFVTAPDFEIPGDVGGDNVYDVIVRVSDGTFNDDQAIAVTVIDVISTLTVTIQGVNDAPHDLTATGMNIDENLDSGQLVGTVTASDVDRGDTALYRLIDDAEGRFTIDNLGDIRVLDSSRLDYESHTSHEIVVEVTDAAGATFSKALTVSLNDVNEFAVNLPTDMDSSDNKVDENVAAGTLVGITVSAIDNDATNNAVFYTMDDSDGGRYAVDGLTGQVRLVGALDYETDGPQRTIRIRATSDDGSTAAADFVIQVGDVNEAPVARGGEYSTSYISELFVSAPSVVANDSDPDGDAISVVLVSNPATGSATLLADGSLWYKPQVGFVGDVTLQYYVTDGVLDSNVQTIVIHVNRPDSVLPPVGVGGGSNGSGLGSGNGNGNGSGSKGGGSNGTAGQEGGHASPGTGAIQASSETSSIMVPIESPSLAASYSLSARSLQTVAVFNFDTLEAGHLETVGFRHGLHKQELSRLSLPELERHLLTQTQASPMIDVLSDQRQDQELVEGRFVQVDSLVATALGTGLAIWLIHVGQFAAALLSTASAWVQLDPLTVIQGSGTLAGAGDEAETSEEIMFDEAKIERTDDR